MEEPSRAIIVIDYRIDEQGAGEAKLSISGDLWGDLDEPPMAIKIARHLTNYLEMHFHEVLLKTAH